MLLLFYQSFVFYSAFQFFSQESPQQRNDQNNAAMELINSVTGVDDEGRSRQRILTFAARRYHNLILYFLLINFAGIF